MRGNPLVELVAVLVMIASVLVGGAYWGVYKYQDKEQKFEEFRKEVKVKQEKANLIFEQAVKETKE